MASQNVFTNLVNAGKKSRLKDFSYTTYATEVALLADTHDATIADGGASFTMAMAEDNGAIWYWKGGQTNADVSSAGNGTSWFDSDKDQEVILELIDAPINTDVLGTIIPAVAPTNLTANTKLVTWTDANGDLHLYQVTDPVGTPVFTEITAPRQATIVTTATDVAGVTAIPARANTVYTNTTTGQVFIVTEDSIVTEISDGNKDYYGVFNTVTLVAGVESVFDVNADATLAVTNLLSTVTEVAFSQYLIDVQLFDVSNNNQLATNMYAVRPITTSTFGITSNIGVDVIASFNFVGK